jgi:CheY-like chemotaxis protein
MPDTNARLVRFDRRLYGSYILNAAVAMVGFVALHALYDTVRNSPPIPAATSYTVAMLFTAVLGAVAALMLKQSFRVINELEHYVRDLAVSPRTLESHALQGTNVLVVDDQEQQLQLLSEALSQAGASVRTATSVKLATQAVDEHAPDVLISDVIMRPGEDLQPLITCLEIKARNTNKKPFRIAVSAYPEVIDEQKLKAMGFDAYLPRPFTAADLAALIERRVHGKTPRTGA